MNRDEMVILDENDELRVIPFPEILLTDEAAGLLQNLIVHDRAADRRHPDGQDTPCLEMQKLLWWLQDNAPDFAKTLPEWCFPTGGHDTDP